MGGVYRTIPSIPHSQKGDTHEHEKRPQTLFLCLVAAILILPGLAACNPAKTNSGSPSAPAEAAPDAGFAFSLEFGSCNQDVLDTLQNTFTKDMIVEPPVTIPFTLTEAEWGAFLHPLYTP